MRLLVNENVTGTVIEELRERGHDVLSVKESLRAEEDDVILARAQADQRIVVTHDKDFGELAFRSHLPASCGVILFRLSGSDHDKDNQRMPSREMAPCATARSRRRYRVVSSGESAAGEELAGSVSDREQGGMPANTLQQAT